MRRFNTILFIALLSVFASPVFAQGGTIPQASSQSIARPPASIPQSSSQSVARPPAAIPQANSQNIAKPPVNPSDISPNNPNALSQDLNNGNLPLCGPNVGQPCFDPKNGTNDSE